MSIDPEDRPQLINKRNEMLKDTEDLLRRRKYLAAISKLKEVIAVSKKLGEENLINGYQMQIQECLDKKKSLDEDIQVIQLDDALREQIIQEQQKSIESAQESAQKGDLKESLALYEKAIEFSLKLEDNKAIWKLSKMISIVEEKLQSLGELTPSIRVSKPVTSVENVPEPAAPQKKIKSPQNTLIQPSPATPEQPTPVIQPPPAAIEPPQTKSETPSTIFNSLEPQTAQKPALFQTPEVESESEESFLDALVEDLDTKPKAESEESFLDSLVEDLDTTPQVQPETPVSSTPIESMKQETNVISEPDSIPDTQDQVPFVPKPPGEAEPKENIPFVPPPLEEPDTISEAAAVDDETKSVEEFIESADKKTRKKLKLAERVAMKKLEEAEKKFGKQMKKKEKKRKKEKKKKAKKKAKKSKDKPEKLSKKEEKFKTKYQSALPDDVLSEIREKKGNGD